MPEGYDIEVGARGLIVRFRAQPTFEGLVAAAQSLGAHPDFGPATPTVWDFSAAPPANMSADEMRRLAPIVARIREGGGRPRVAIVTPKDANFAGARMFGGVNEPRIRVELSVFRSLHEARAWAFGPREDNGNGSSA